MKTQAEIAKTWKEKGFSCGLWVDPPGQRWENYRHDTDELIYVLEGMIELEVSGRKRLLQARDEALIPARANHSVRNMGSTESRWLYGYRSR